MSHLRTTGSVDDLRAILTPRDNVLVSEMVAPAATDKELVGGRGGSVTFIADAGPFDSYRRTVSWGWSGERVTIDQSLRFRLAIPYWSWLFHLPAARALRDGLDASARPWWSTPDRLSADQARTVAAVTLLNTVAGMLYGLLTQVLTFISADLGDGSSGEQTTVLAIVRAGVIVTLFVSVLADRVGRRRAALFAFYGSGIITVLTALLPSLQMVTAAQFVSRNLAIAALLAADTIVTEEMPAGSRAMVAGLGTLAYGLGAGIVVMTLPLADVGPWGWRLTFLVAGFSLPLMFHCRRYLPESRRYRIMDLERKASTVSAATTDTEPAASDAVAVSKTPSDTTIDDGPTDRTASRGRFGAVRRTDHRFARRLLIVGALFVLLNVFHAPSSQLQNDYLRTQAGFSGTLMAFFVLSTSTPGGIGVLIGGRVSDVHGRRWAIIPGLVAIAVFYSLFFSSTNAIMWIASLLASVIGGMAAPALAVITAELFPTARRATVRGIVTALAVIGSITGLLVGGALIERFGYTRAFMMLAVAPLSAAAIAFVLPATHSRELEVTSS